MRLRGARTSIGSRVSGRLTAHPAYLLGAGIPAFEARLGSGGQGVAVWGVGLRARLCTSDPSDPMGSLKFLRGTPFLIRWRLIATFLTECLGDEHQGHNMRIDLKLGTTGLSPVARGS